MNTITNSLQLLVSSLELVNVVVLSKKKKRWMKIL